MPREGLALFRRVRGLARGLERDFGARVVARDLEPIEPLAGERGLAAEPLQVVRHELGARAAPGELESARAAVDREVGEPELRRVLAPERGEESRKAFGRAERMLVQRLDEPLLVAQRRVEPS